MVLFVIKEASILKEKKFNKRTKKKKEQYKPTLQALVSFIEKENNVFFCPFSWSMVITLVSNKRKGSAHKKESELKDKKKRAGEQMQSLGKHLFATHNGLFVSSIHFEIMLLVLVIIFSFIRLNYGCYWPRARMKYFTIRKKKVFFPSLSSVA